MTTRPIDQAGFLSVPEMTPEARRLLDEDIDEVGYVMNLTRIWAYQPGTNQGLFDLMKGALSGLSFDLRTRGILVTATASTLGDSYCSLAWGKRLATATDPSTASGVVRGDDAGLTPGEQALAAWARKVARAPNSTTAADVQTLRDAGYSDAAIFGMTAYVALRIAFSTVNDALGARPDVEFRASAPQSVLDAVTFGRPIADPM
jgi:uncharacterized peroxidase-related enzyme